MIGSWQEVIVPGRERVAISSKRWEQAGPSLFQDAQGCGAIRVRIRLLLYWTDWSTSTTKPRQEDAVA
jgi:hypothetical protein